MEFLILMAIIIAYSSLSSKLNRITNTMPNTLKERKKGFPSLKEMKGKYIEINIAEELELLMSGKTKGILKDYNDTWLVLEMIGKKGKKELYYYRLNNIISIDIIDS